MKIVIEGNDGTGKSTLAMQLRALGFDVQDRGAMTKATLDDAVNPEPDHKYILLVCPWEVSKQRLIAAGKDMNEIWHTDESLQKYDRIFRELVERFDAHVIETQQDQLETLVQALVAIDMPIRVGVPTGRLKSGLFNGLEKHIFGETRKMVVNIQNVTFVRTRTKTYPQMIAMDLLDYAIVGSDALAGNPFAHLINVTHEEIQWSPKSKTNLVVAFAGKTKMLPKTSLLRVVTPYPEWARQILADRGVPHTIFQVDGGSELLVAQDVGDVVFDVVETGETLQDNGLNLIEIVGTLSTCVIGVKK